ncbi:MULTISPECIES: WecB/TagA/CpsF family glycosyltransferase [Paenibacillus]|uniref:WecB/TagA/CpsF family glycosyltransferase n=1 Tax=Paenibacillus TaxID=44249 RepID=UPI0022B8DC85|nr:WecB/TagA/CpsF family glycosyltransferase [Paenibacillus caseinilyticus]MCZ8523274.1 WecB/TagA/CpsF family glycosyltransferase [Paenibacillus caseinilyticus]
MKQTAAVMGVTFSRDTLAGTLQTITGHLDKKDGGYMQIITCNPEIVMASGQDEELRAILQGAGLVTADGIGIVLASRWLGDPLPERVTGFDILMGLLEEGNRKGYSFYLFGADPATNDKAAEVISGRYPGLRIAGRKHGYYKPEEEAGILADIAAAKPDILVVALGAPRAERWIYRNRAKLPVRAAMGVGGSLDVIAGKVKRAPVVWQKLNLEWLYRLLSEPSRWRRQLVLPKFAVRALFSRGRS